MRGPISSPLTLPALMLLAGLATASAQSLWTAPGSEERSMLADRKAAAPGDILTIVVSETAASSSSNSKRTNSKVSVDAGVEQFLFPGSRFGTHNGALPGVKLGGGDTFEGGGAVSSAQTLTGRAAVLVTDVLPNGNLVIAGARRVTFEGETRHVVLQGIVRPDDVTTANTIASSNIADARVEFISEGSLTDAAKKGWLAKIYERIRPY
jgi:flagellar L-ring protein FlgH